MTLTRRILLGTLAVIVIFVLLFDWDWLRKPLENYVSKKTQREFSISHLGVKLGWNPTIQLRDVYFANADWAEKAPMAKIGNAEVTVSLRDAFEGRILIPRVALTDADLHFERLPDNRKNWVISEPSDSSPSTLRISSLSVTRGNLSYIDRGLPFSLKIAVETFDPKVGGAVASADAKPVNTSYTTRYTFGGTYHDAKFSGDALTGDVLSFQESGVTFPLRGHLKAGTTELNVEGTVADAAKLSAIDVRLRIAGQTLANLYPFLALPLPASPPYKLEGHLTQSGARYGLDEIKGQIGSTDLEGSGGYVDQKPRPTLQAKLHSNLLDVADLGPLVGVTTKSDGAPKVPTQEETKSRPAAQAKERATNGDRVLPAGTASADRLLPGGKLEGGRLKVIDAEVEWTAGKVQAPDQLAVNDVRVGLHLKDAMLRLDPLDVSIAGGRIVSKVALDGREPTLRASMDVDAKQLQLAQLVPKSKTVAQSKGVVGGKIELKGVGNSIADLAAKSDGHVAAVISNARISNLIDAASGLNGGKIIKLFVGGDKDIGVRCGAAAFDVQRGQGTSKVFVVDTEQTRIDGDGKFNLDDEHFDLRIAPQPKEAGILSLRTPVRLYGSFRHPDFELEKKDLILRAGGAVALGLIAPIAALIPLIETGPGSDTDCGKLYASAQAVTDKARPAKPTTPAK